MAYLLTKYAHHSLWRVVAQLVSTLYHEWALQRRLMLEVHILLAQNLLSNMCIIENRDHEARGSVRWHYYKNLIIAGSKHLIINDFKP